MALFHRATITPSKAELLTGWATTQPWFPSGDGDLTIEGAFRFNDPSSRAGIETHLASVNGTLLQMPLIYREAPLDGADDWFVAEIEHSALGTRWVYDGAADPLYQVMLAAVAMTGQGEALGMALYDERWHIAPANVRIQGGGWGTERVAVDNFATTAADHDATVMRNDRFELTFFRRPEERERPPMGLSATWDGQPDPVLLAQIREL